MLYTKTMLRACAVSLLALSLLMLVLWSTGNYPPVALANGGGGGTMYTLSKCTPTNGTISNSPTGTIFASGTVVTLTATPSAGYQFAGWSGSISGLTNPIQLPMTSNKTVCATFNKIQRTLTVQIDGGCSGSVTPTVGDHQYDHGTLVAVTASPAEYFDHWSGCGVPSGQESNNSISVPMDANKTVKAHYKPATLTMAVSGGEGAATSPSVGTHTFCQGEYIEISASPTEGFSHWVGDATVPTNRTTTVFMDGPTKSVTAVFDSVTLTMDKSGGVSGASVSPSEGTYTYAKGATVTLSASPSDFFIEWTGGYTGTSASDSFKILENTAVTGVFAAKYLTVTLEGNTGTTDPEPDIPHAYATGDNASISVTPAEAFDHWEGSGVPVGAEETHPLEVEMTVDRAITAVLKPAHTLTTAIVAANCEECTVSPDPDESPHSYPPGSPPVNVAASPEARFDYWEGDLSGNSPQDPTISIPMDANKSLTAHFKPMVTLTLAKVGEGELNPVEEGVHTYIRDETESVVASPASGFDHWEGDLDENDVENNPMLVVKLTQSKSLTAVFKPMYTLTMAREGNGGTVMPGVGTHDYREGETAQLLAVGNDLWIFTGWSGDASGTFPSVNLPMNANKSVTANFIAGVKITVNKDGQGTVSPGTGVYPAGGTKTFTATPASGWRWSHWEGNLGGVDGGDPSLDLPMDQARTITAVFVEQVTLTIVKNLIGNLPAEGGTVSPGEGEHEYDKGPTPIALTATPAAGWRFKQWSGGASGTNPSTTVDMDGDKTVTATFIQRHSVTTASHTRGIITPESGTWDHGQSASFTWEKESNFCFCQFTHWVGLPESFTTPEWGSGTSDQTTVSFAISNSHHLDAYDENIFVLLTPSVDANGCAECTVDPDIPTAYLRDSDATVTATGTDGWAFVGWEGDVPEGLEEDNPLVMPMYENRNVTAVFEPLTASLTAENSLTECMEGRVVTFTATVSQNFPVSSSEPATYKFYFREADGSYWTKTVTSALSTCETDAQADDVPSGDADHKFSTPNMVEVISDDETASVSSDILWIDVYELWILSFRDAMTAKDWKVVVGENIEYNATASSDCTNWLWDMPEGIPDRWNPTGVTSKSGSSMVIPTSDMPEASDWNHFGAAYGKVTVSCTDGAGNVYSFSSHDMSPSKDASVFFDPSGTVHPPDDQSGVFANQGEYPTENWFYYWRAALIPNVPEVYYKVVPDKFPGWYQPYLENGPVTVTDALNPNFAAPYSHFNDILHYRFTQQQLNIAAQQWGCIVTRPTMEGKQGIDYFYTVVTHELKHRSDHETGLGFPDGDGDLVSDNVDPAPSEINGTRMVESYDWTGYDWSNPTNLPTPIIAPVNGDKEFSARQVEGVTAPTSKDWSKGGKQW